jgi:hypothetical protein
MNYEKIIEKLVTEVGYRAEEGYPDFSKKAHIKILEGLLKKRGYGNETVREIISGISANGNLILESQQSEIINSIIDILKSKKDFDIKILERIQKLIARDSSIEKELIELIIEYGLPKDKATDITEKSFEYDSGLALLSYLKNRTIKINDISGKKFNQILSSVGLTSKFANWLINYTYPTQPPTGRGEISLGLILKNGSTKAKKGDIYVDGSEVEVKGNNGRLVGQHGYGNQNFVYNSFSKDLDMLVTKYKNKYDLTTIKIPTSGNTEYNFTKGNWALDIISKQLIELTEKKINKKDVIGIWKNGLSKYYLKMDFKWLDSHVGEDGAIKNRKSFIETFFQESYKYYADNEKFTKLIVFDKKTTKVVVANVADNLIKSGIKVSATPSFSSKAGTQGATFAVKV